MASVVGTLHVPMLVSVRKQGKKRESAKRRRDGSRRRLGKQGHTQAASLTDSQSVSAWEFMSREGRDELDMKKKSIEIRALCRANF